MTDLEDRIREVLKDPHWQLPPWPDPMSRIRRTMHRQRAIAVAATAITVAAIVTPLAMVSGQPAHRARPNGHRPAATSPSSPASGLLQPSPGKKAQVPPSPPPLRAHIPSKRPA